MLIIQVNLDKIGNKSHSPTIGDIITPMATQTHLPTQTLYDRDYVLWIEATVHQLRTGMGVKIDSLSEKTISTIEQALDNNWFPDNSQ